ncbi:MAG: hypothetical protein WC763_04730 [Candidatus Paceibacterota bacterium]|jgi:hypothetical protein
MISDFYKTLFVVKRSVWTTDGSDNPYSEEQEVGQFMGHIQQAAPELVQSLGLSLTKSFSIWCPVDTDVREGDSLTSVQGVYSVRAVQQNAVGSNKHLQLVVMLDQISGS